MKVFAYTEKGPQKNENEDRILIGRTVLSGGLLFAESENILAVAVADGVGGRKAGAVASHFVATELSKADHIDEDLLIGINEALNRISAENESLYGLATTLSLVSFSESPAVFHIGNSRVYNLNGGKYLSRVTKDDTTVQFLLDSGQLTEEKAKDYERRSEINACLGSGFQDAFKLKVLEPGILADVIVLTTDGIHDYVSEDEMEESLVECKSDYSTACRLLAERARKNGSIDDCSMVIVSKS